MTNSVMEVEWNELEKEEDFGLYPPQRLEMLDPYGWGELTIEICVILQWARIGLSNCQYTSLFKSVGSHLCASQKDAATTVRRRRKRPWGENHK